jgi:hypothetical protein
MNFSTLDLYSLQLSCGQSIRAHYAPTAVDQDDNLIASLRVCVFDDSSNLLAELPELSLNETSRGCSRRRVDSPEMLRYRH